MQWKKHSKIFRKRKLKGDKLFNGDASTRNYNNDYVQTKQKCLLAGRYCGPHKGGVTS